MIGFSFCRMIKDGLFAAVLWDIHEKVKKEGYVQVSSVRNRFGHGPCSFFLE